MAVLAAYVGSLVPALGWTLAHFLWQGALVALVLELLLKTCRTAQARHNLALGALLLMAAAPVMTFAWLQGEVRIEFVPAGFPGLAASLAAQQALTWEKVAVAGWLTGVAVLAFRTAGGLLLVERLRQEAQPLPPVWAARCRLLQRRLAGRLSVAFAQSRAVATPLVAGWLKPMVLIPAAALVRMPADQLEALILHELAHVRRLDAFANLIQTVVETLLFYHPAVWRVSRRIRLEREHCCDDLAVAAIRDPALYVRALRSMETLRPAEESVLAANGGDLKARAARILGLAAAPARPALPRVAAILILTLTGAVVTHSAAVQAEPTQGPPVAVPASAEVAVQAPAAVPVPMPVSPIRRPFRTVLAEAPSPPAAAPSVPWNDPAMAERVKALGPMPPDSLPAAQAAWRLKSYDLALETDRRHLETMRSAVAGEREALSGYSAGDTGDWRRLKALNGLDVHIGREGTAELHLQTTQAARAAVVEAERLRRAVAAGKAKADTAAAAQARATRAERLAEAAAETVSDFVEGANRTTVLLDQDIAKATAGYPQVGPSEQVERLTALKWRAHLEGVAYGAVRDAVDAGKRPAADLEAAAQSLKIVQTAYWDAWDEMAARLKALAAHQVCSHAIKGPDGKSHFEPLDHCPAIVWTARPVLPVLPPRAVAVAEPLPVAHDPATYSARLKALGKMPSDSEPAAQAAWRDKHYTLVAERARAEARSAADMAGRQRDMVARLKIASTDEPQRLLPLSNLDMQLSRVEMSELKAEAAETARQAFAKAEVVRLALAAHKAMPKDLAAARDAATEAARAMSVAERALSDRMTESTRSSSKLLTALNATMPEMSRSPGYLQDTDRMVLVNQRVRMESLGYAVVRDAVEAGRRPASDLDAAAQSLKAAQSAQYDFLDGLFRAMATQRVELQKRSEQRLADQQARVAEMEAQLPAAGAAERPAAERRLALARANLEVFRLAADQPKLPDAPPRPNLPQLPARSWADGPAS